MKLGIALQLEKMMNAISMAKLEAADKNLILDINRALRPVAEAWSKDEKASLAKVESKQLTSEEHNAYFMKCMEEEVEVKIPAKLSQEVLAKLMDANDSWSAGAFLLIDDYLVAKQ